MSVVLTILAAVIVSASAIAAIVLVSKKVSDRKMDRHSERAGAAGLGYGAYAAGHDLGSSGAGDCGGGGE